MFYTKTTTPYPGEQFSKSPPPLIYVAFRSNCAKYMHVCSAIKYIYICFLAEKKDRESAVRGNSKLTEEQKKKWLTVMSNDFMSSEESEEDQIVVHPLPWRTPYMNTMFLKIDAYVTEKKSPQARRQTKSRKTGFPSTRQRPFDSVSD